MRAEDLDLRVKLGLEFLFKHVDSMLLSASSFLKLVSVEEAGRIDVLECLVADV